MGAPSTGTGAPGWKSPWHWPTWWSSWSAAGARPEPEPPGGRAPFRRARLLALHLAFFLALLLSGVLGLLAPPASASSLAQGDDPALKARLEAAIAAAPGFSDRFEAEVWLEDMSRRLSRHVPDPEERLEILRHAHAEATRAGLPPEMVLAVIDVESGFQRYAVSRANAQGLMQVMRFWLQELGMEGTALFDVQKNLRMGCTILRYYYDLEKGDWTRALARYNGSLGSRKYPNKVFERLRTRWYRG